MVQYPARAPRQVVSSCGCEKHVPQHLLIMSDDGKDSDDELAKLLLKFLDQEHLALCKGFIAALHPAPMRARLAKGTLKVLGLDVEVGIGSSMGNSGSDQYEFDVNYLAEDHEVLPSGVQLFVDQLGQAGDGLFTLVVLCGMRDAWELLRDNTELFRRKVAQVVVMGGVEVIDQEPARDDGGYLIPDSAANNAFDMEAARHFYREVQRHSIPLRIVSRWAAYATKLPLSLFDRMAETGHPVATRLQKAQQKALQHLWRRSNMPLESRGREGLPPRCTKEWFSNVFLGGKGLDRSAEDSIWDLAGTFQPYDCIALLAALPGICERYLDPHVVEVEGLHGTVSHEIMGLSETVHGVLDSGALITWLEAAMMRGVTMGRPIH